MDLIFLGTGNAHVTECYNTCFALRENGRIFLVDTGGGSGILHQLKYSGLNWREIHDIFITHKHVDHLLGAIWLIREFYTGITEGEYEGDVTFYGHDEVITLLRDIAFQLLPRKETRMFDDRIRFKVVTDGQTRTIIGKETTFFDIVSIKAKQFGFSLDLGGGERLSAAATSRAARKRSGTPKTARGCCTRRSVSIRKSSVSSRTNGIIRPSKTRASLPKELACAI